MKFDAICGTYLRNWSEQRASFTIDRIFRCEYANRVVYLPIKPTITNSFPQISALRWECDRNKSDMGA